MKTKITFAQTSNKFVNILMNGEKVGDIWVEESYSGENSIQICGIEKIDGPWGCGRINNSRDVCAIFKDKDEKQKMAEEVRCCHDPCEQKVPGSFECNTCKQVYKVQIT